MLTSVFPDQVHLLQLQKDLWLESGSKASIMVGAGFSFNASPSPGNVKKMPTWSELVWEMFQELNPLPSNASDMEVSSNLGKFNQMNPLTIASEYEASFGRGKLEQLIKDVVPDLDYEPSELYTQLLELPWRDVFTTNYDTLLERTNTLDHSYQTVRSIDELTSAIPPRIVKLHGSFPVSTPFIITEEDYRRYPIDFAPYVNTVQQSLIENSFVLIGFSGDDPNFLAWIGWIRDQLGNKHSPIYLVGLLNLSDAKRKLLTSRGVTPIDLAPIFSHSPSRINQHKLCIEWFLQCIHNSKPRSIKDWGENLIQEKIKNFTPELVIHTELNLPSIDTLPQNHSPLEKELLKNIFNVWRQRRNSYPGWVAPSNGIRSRLVRNTDRWADLILSGNHIEWQDRILLFREINWRLETALRPLFDNQVKQFELALTDWDGKISENGWLSTTQSELDEALIVIELALLRESREVFDTDRWNRHFSKLDSKIRNFPQYSDQLKYEEILWAVWNIKRQKALELLEIWNTSKSSPLFSIRKASLLAELNKIEESAKILTTSLAGIRSALNVKRHDIELMSLEGWCTSLLYGVEGSLDHQQGETRRQEFLSRWEHLDKFDCSPWPIKQFFNDYISKKSPELKNGEKSTRQFDGELTKQYSYNSLEYTDAITPAFSFLRLFEWVGIPFRTGFIDYGGDTLVNSVKWLVPHIGYHNPMILIRSGKYKLFETQEILSNLELNSLSDEVIASLFEWCYNLIESETNTPPTSTVTNDFNIILCVVEFISRLSLRLPDERLNESFDLCCALHSLEKIELHRIHSNVCEKWFYRLFKSAQAPLLCSWGLTLTNKFTLCRNTELETTHREVWSDPLGYFNWSTIYDSELSQESMTELSDSIDSLIQKSQELSDVNRARMILRLQSVQRGGLMSRLQENAFNSLLEKSRQPNGLINLPGQTSLIQLHLPYLTETQKIDATKLYLLQKLKSGYNKHLAQDLMVCSKPVIKAWDQALGKISWTEKETTQITQAILTFWRENKVKLESPSEFNAIHSNDLHRTVSYTVQLLVRITFESSTAVAKQQLDSATQLLQDFERLGYDTIHVQPYLLIKHNNLKSSVSDLILQGISGENGNITPSATALRHWCILADRDLVKRPPSKITTEWVKRVAYRRSNKLDSLVRQLSLAIYESPRSFSVKNLELLIESLAYWEEDTQLNKSNLAKHSQQNAHDLPVHREKLGMLCAAIESWQIQRKKTSDLRVTHIISKLENDNLPDIRNSTGNWRASFTK